MSEHQTDSRRRKKPWYRARNIVLLVMLVAVLLFSVELFRAYTSERNTSVDYAAKINALSAAHQGVTLDDPNGWASLVRAGEAADRQLNAIRHDAESLPIEWDDWERAYCRDAPDTVRSCAMLVVNGLRDVGVYASLDEALDQPRFMRDQWDPSPIHQTSVPELGQFRSIARGLRCSACESARAGDFDRCIQDLEYLFALARRISKQGGMLDHLISLAVTALALDEVRNLVLEGAFDQDALQRVNELLARFTPIADMRQALDRERQLTLDALQFSHSKRGHVLIASSGHNPTDLPDWLARVANVTGRFKPRMSETMALCDRVFDAAIDDVGRAPSEYTHSAIEAEVEENARLRVIVPAFAKAIRSDHRLSTDIEATRLIVQIALHHAAHGTWPTSLDAFNPGQDLIGFAPFVYRAEPDPTSGHAFTLYSVGADGVDDGGIPPNRPLYATSGADGDWVFTIGREPYEGWPTYFARQRLDDTLQE